MPKKKITNLNEEFDLKLFTIILKRNFYWLIVLLTIGLAGAYLYLRYTHPIFQAQAGLKVGIVNNANAVLNQPGTQMLDLISGSNNAFAGDVELLRSKVMLARVIERMPLEVTYFARGNVLDNELYEKSPFTVEYEIRDSAYFGVPINITFNSEKEYELNWDYEGLVGSGTYATGVWIETAFAKLRISIVDITSIRKQESKIKKSPFYFILNTTSDLVSAYADDYQVQVVNPIAQTLRVIFKDKNAVKTAEFVNTVLDEFNIYDQERKSEGSNRSLDFINHTITDMDSELKISEISLEMFKRSNKIIDPTENAKDVLSHIKELIDTRVNCQLTLAVLNRMERDIQQSKPIDNLLPLMAGQFDDDVIMRLVERLQELQDKKANLRFVATEENTAIRSIDAEIQLQKQNLTSSIRSAINSQKERILSIDEQIGNFESNFMMLPSKEAELSRLKRFYEVNQKFFQLLLEKKVEFSITKAGIVSNNIILDRATEPISPLTPNRRLILAGSILLGFIIGFLIVFLKYLFYNEITSLEEINRGIIEVHNGNLFICEEVRKHLPPAEFE